MNEEEQEQYNMEAKQILDLITSLKNDSQFFIELAKTKNPNFSPDDGDEKLTTNEMASQCK